jgi:hypothetical protein
MSTMTKLSRTIAALALSAAVIREAAAKAAH